MSKVYLLEDDMSICELVSCALSMSDIDVCSFNTVAEFTEGLEKEVPDLCLLDVMLPDGNGLDMLRAVKKKYPALQCLMLSALSQETDKVKGLNLGADDYIAKPFSTLELTARVKAALRRFKPTQSEENVTAGALVLNLSQYTAYLDGRPLKLNHKEFKLLSCLVRNEGNVLSRDKLLDEVWGYEVFAETRTVDNHIARLRKCGLKDNIVTVFAGGYKFVRT